jgi:O-antigen/teichoic acid export membrane protein
MNSIFLSIKSLITKPGLHQGIGVIFDQGLYSLTNFLTGVLLARTLLKEDYGIYILALSFIITIMGIQRAIITVPYTVYNKEYEQKDLEAYTGSTFVHQLILLSISTVICLVVSKIFFLKGKEFYSNLIIVFAFLFAATGVLLRDFVRSFLLARLKIWQSVFMGIFINILQLTILWLLFLENEINIHNSFLIIGGCSFLPALIVFIKGHNITIYRNKIIGDFLNNFKLGKWIFGSSVIFMFSSQSYTWMLSFFADNKSVAVLGVTSSLANILGPFLQGIYSFILPKMAHSRKEHSFLGVIAIMKKAIAFLAIIFGLWLFVGILFGDHLLSLIYSSKYYGYSSVLIIVIISSFISGITSPIYAALEALERADISFKSLLGGLIVTLFIGVFLIYKWGIYGAAIGMLLSNLTNSLLRCRGLLVLISNFKSDPAS